MTSDTHAGAAAALLLTELGMRAAAAHTANTAGPSGVRGGVPGAEPAGEGGTHAGDAVLALGGGGVHARPPPQVVGQARGVTQEGSSPDRRGCHPVPCHDALDAAAAAKAAAKLERVRAKNRR